MMNPEKSKKLSKQSENKQNENKENVISRVNDKDVVNQKNSKQVSVNDIIVLPKMGQLQDQKLKRNIKNIGGSEEMSTQIVFQQCSYPQATLESIAQCITCGMVFDQFPKTFSCIHSNKYCADCLFGYIKEQITKRTLIMCPCLPCDGLLNTQTGIFKQLPPEMQTQYFQFIRINHVNFIKFPNIQQNQPCRQEKLYSPKQRGITCIVTIERKDQGKDKIGDKIEGNINSKNQSSQQMGILMKILYTIGLGFCLLLIAVLAIIYISIAITLLLILGLGIIGAMMEGQGQDCPCSCGMVEIGSRLIGFKKWTFSQLRRIWQ